MTFSWNVVEERSVTASIYPKSRSYPSMYMYNNLQTYIGENQRKIPSNKLIINGWIVIFVDTFFFGNRQYPYFL